MSLRKDFINLKKDYEEFKSKVESNELKMLRETKKKYDALVENLKNVRFRVKDIKYQEGSDKVYVVYDIPTVVLELNEGREIIPNATFKSINMLDLVSPTDWSKMDDFFKKNKIL